MTDPSARHTQDHQAAGVRQVARGGIANLIGAGYSGIATFGVTALVTRVASTDDAGLYFSALSVLLIAASVAVLGTPVGNVYFLARYRGLGKQHKLRAALTAGAIPVVGLSVLLVAVGLVFRDYLGHLLFGDEVAGGPAMMTVVACTLPVVIAVNYALGATRGLGTMRPTVVADKFVNPTVQLLALLALAAAGATTAVPLAWTRAVAFVAVALVAIPWLAKLLRREPPPAGTSVRESWRPSREEFRAYWRFTAPRAVGQIAQSGIQRIDIVLVALWLGPTDAALYAAATRFLVFGQMAANSIGTAVQPRFSALAARREMGSLQHLYRTSTAWVMFATWPFYMTFLVNADWLMQVFGSEYTRGAVVLQILSCAMLVATACGAVDAVLLMAGRSVLTMMNSWIALVLNLGLNIWLIPRLGIAGAALAWTASILAANLVPLVQVYVTLRVHPFGRITLLSTTVPTLLYGVLPWVVAILGGGLVGAIGSLVAASAIYVPLVWRWRSTLGLTELLRRGPGRSASRAAGRKGGDLGG